MTKKILVLLSILNFLLPLIISAQREPEPFIDKIVPDVYENDGKIIFYGWKIIVFDPNTEKENDFTIESPMMAGKFYERPDFFVSKEIEFLKNLYPNYSDRLWLDLKKEIIAKENNFQIANEARVLINSIEWDKDGLLLVKNAGYGFIFENTNNELLIVTSANVVYNSEAVEVILSGFRGKNQGRLDEIIVKDFNIDDKRNLAFIKVPAGGASLEEKKRLKEEPLLPQRPYPYSSYNNKPVFIFSGDGKIKAGKIIFNKKDGWLLRGDTEGVPIGMPIIDTNGFLLGMYMGDNKIMLVLDIYKGAIDYYQKNPPTINFNNSEILDKEDNRRMLELFVNKKGYKVLKMTEIESNYYYRPSVGLQVVVQDSKGKEHTIKVFYGPSYITSEPIQNQVDKQLRALEKKPTISVRIPFLKTKISKIPPENIYGEKAIIRNLVEIAGSTDDIYVDGVNFQKDIRDDDGNLLGWKLLIFMSSKSEDYEQEMKEIEVLRKNISDKSYKDQIFEQLQKDYKPTAPKSKKEKEKRIQMPLQPLWPKYLYEAITGNKTR